MKAAFNLILAHAIATLPDSIRERKFLLAALLVILPKDHPLRDRVEGLRLHLESHEQHQLNLGLEFSNLANAGDGEAKADGNGDTGK